MVFLKLKQGASYITNRRSVTYYPHGGNTYSPTGVKVIKLMLTGSDWLDPGSLRLMYDLVNTNGNLANRLYPISGPWSFFRRLRIICGGQVVEDIDYYNHVHELFHVMMPTNVRNNDDIEGFGNGLPNPSTLSYKGSSLTDDNAFGAQLWPGIAGGSSMPVSFRFLSGLLNQDKFLPIRYCPITIELELVNQLTDPVVIGNGNSEVVQYRNNISTSWMIQNVMAKADVVTLDNSLDNEYAQHLLEGKSLPISYSTYVSQLLSISSNNNFTANITRSFTRLKSVFSTFYRTDVDWKLHSDYNKDWNTFYHPMLWDKADGGQYIAYNPASELQLQIQVGSKLMPEYPCNSTKEAFAQLRKCLGIHSSTWHSIDISDNDYRSTRFIFGIDCEKMLSAGYTGLNTKAGDLMTIRAKYLGTRANATPDTLYVILHSDQILNIRDTGVEVLE